MRTPKPKPWRMLMAKFSIGYSGLGEESISGRADCIPMSNIPGQ